MFRVLGVSDDVGYRMIEAGEFPIPTVKIGSILKCRRRDFDAFVEGTGTSA